MYQTRYNIKKANTDETNGLIKLVVNMLSPDKVVEISKASHLPITLLHHKFYLPTYQTSRNIENLNIQQIREAFESRFWNLIWFCYKKNFKALLIDD